MTWGDFLFKVFMTIIISALVVCLLVIVAMITFLLFDPSLYNKLNG